MHVLVCDDDAALRFVVKRWLTTTLGCVVSESGDGVEALDALSYKHVDLLLLDLGLPRLSGMEVVEAIRESGTHADLPIVVLSNERRLDVIRQVVGLGVSDYLLKPLRAAAVRERISPLLSRARQRRRAGATVARQLGPDTTALIVDGDANFRHAFTSVAEKFGPIVAADSGADAVAAFRAAPADLVFIGQDLGIVGLDAMMRKIRDAVAVPPAFVSVADGASEAGDAAEFDAVLPRSFQPGVIAASLQPFIRHTGPLTEFRDIAPGFEHTVDTAVSQVLGMMADLPVTVAAETPDAPDAGLVATVTIAAGPFALDVAFAVTRESAATLATRLTGDPESAADDEIVASTMAELANMITGRIDAWGKDHGLPWRASLPATRPLAADDFAVAPAAGHGFLRGYLAGDAARVVMRIVATRPAQAV